MNLNTEQQVKRLTDWLSLIDAFPSSTRAAKLLAELSALDTGYNALTGLSRIPLNALNCAKNEGKPL